MKNFSKNICLAVMLFFLVGCSRNMYYWGNYNIGLYRYYKNPEEREKFIEHLQKIIQTGEQGGVVPPGIYAEYGYILYEGKQYEQAIEFFQKEYDRWPESQILMSKMIRNAKKSIEVHTVSNDKDIVENENNDKP